MDINLQTEPMLGNWRTPSGVWVCEFQFASQLIYVEHTDRDTSATRLAAAQRLVNAVWDDMSAAVSFAEHSCTGQMAELINLCETHLPGESPLWVYSIHFQANKPHPSYTLSTHPDFNWNRTLTYQDEGGQEHSVCLEKYEPAQEVWIHVKRLDVQQFELEV